MEWNNYKIEELGRVITGKTPPARIEDAFSDCGTPFVTPRDMNGQMWIESTERYLTKKGLDSVRNSIVPSNSIAVSCIGAEMGKASLLVKDSITNQQINSIVVDQNKYNLVFVYYVLSTKQKELKAIAGGSAVPILNKGHFSKFSISMPNKDEQNKIVKILRSLDDKIAINQQINQTLESMAQTLFKSWFIDFDPVKAKMAGRVPKGMDADLLALFPDSFEDSELGQIPKGWRHTHLIKEFKLLMGQSPPSDTYNENNSGIPFFQGIRDFKTRYPENRVYCSAPTRIADKNDTLVSVRAPVGSVNMAFEKLCIGRGVAAVRHKSASRSYTYYYMKSLEEKFRTYEAGGTVFGSINKTDFSEIEVLQFDPKIVSAFESICFPLEQQIEVLSVQITTLAETRDTLLPKLLAGELRVNDVEA